MGRAETAHVWLAIRALRLSKASINTTNAAAVAKPGVGVRADVDVAGSDGARGGRSGGSWTTSPAVERRSHLCCAETPSNGAGWVRSTVCYVPSHASDIRGRSLKLVRCDRLEGLRLRRLLGEPLPRLLASGLALPCTLKFIAAISMLRPFRRVREFIRARV